MTDSPPAGWHSDPFRRYTHRYWDGGRWTEHVGSNGQQHVDPPVQSPPTIATQPTAVSAPQPPARRVSTPADSRVAGKIQRQITKSGVPNVSGRPDTAFLNEPVLVINQKGKLVELRAEFAIFDQSGRQVAAVRGKRVSNRLQVVDMSGRQLLDLRRQGSFLSSRITVNGESGVKLGRIVPSASWNHPDRDFKLEGAHDEAVGEVYGEGRRGASQHLRHREFHVQDATGAVVAQISKTRAGLAKEMFTKGDNYVVSFSGTVDPLLRSLSIAMALIIDSRFHQG